MRYTIFCCVLLVSLLLPSFAVAEVQQLFDQANSEYVKKNYSVAIHDYERIIQQHGASPALFYNLALAYAEADQPGKAILNLERARALAPADREIATSLTEFRKKEGLFTPPARGARKIAALLAIDQWAWLGLVSLVLFSSFFLISVLRQKKRKRWPVMLQRCFLLTTILFFAVVAYIWDDADPYIITAENSRLLISPIKEADLVVSLRAGQKVFPIKTHGRYLYVRTEGRKRGWVASDSVEAVNAPAIFDRQEDHEQTGKTP